MSGPHWEAGVPQYRWFALQITSKIFEPVGAMNQKLTYAEHCLRSLDTPVVLRYQRPGVGSITNSTSRFGGHAGPTWCLERSSCGCHLVIPNTVRNCIDLRDFCQLFDPEKWRDGAPVPTSLRRGQFILVASGVSSTVGNGDEAVRFFAARQWTRYRAPRDARRARTRRAGRRATLALFDIQTRRQVNEIPASEALR